MRFAPFLLVLVSAQAASLTIDPPVIYDCNGTHGKATVRWKGASGPVQLLVGPSRAVFTGYGDTSGSAETGTWVGDGLEFQLVNPQGAVEALAVARVQCNAAQSPANGIVSESFFPLEPGNQWIYRSDSRLGTANYVTWTVTGHQQIAGRRYSEITVTIGDASSLGMFLREEAGQIYRMTGTTAEPREELYLNPAAASHAPFGNALGSYSDAASRTIQTTLSRETQVFIRGVGLARSRTDLLTGSSGGFVSDLELVDFRLASGPRVELSFTPKIALSIEKTFLDVTGKQLTNCAIPCYYAACGLGSPVDPPNTYKPCARTRIEAAAEGDFQVELTLHNLQGTEVYRSNPLQASGETIRYVQMPLYSVPNTPFSAGNYVLTARMKRGFGDIGVASMPIELR
jgi:hypothetical protein